MEESTPIKAVDLIKHLQRAMSLEQNIVTAIYGIVPKAMSHTATQ